MDSCFVLFGPHQHGITNKQAQVLTEFQLKAFNCKNKAAFQTELKYVAKTNDTLKKKAVKKYLPFVNKIHYPWPPVLLSGVLRTPIYN